MNKRFNNRNIQKMATDEEKAFLMFKLAKSKGGCWGAKYDRLEHLKKFQDLDKIVKEMGNLGWIIINKKPNYTGVSLNSHYKKEIVEFIEKNLPEMRGILK